MINSVILNKQKPLVKKARKQTHSVAHLVTNYNSVRSSNT